MAWDPSFVEGVESKDVGNARVLVFDGVEERHVGLKLDFSVGVILSA